MEGPRKVRIRLIPVLFSEAAVLASREAKWLMLTRPHRTGPAVYIPDVA